MNSATEISRDGSHRAIERVWVPEAPVALEFNGLAYAVMMATPTDLEDFALGFALSEGLAKQPSDLTDLDVVEVEKGWIVRGSLTGLGIEQLTERVRARVAESSCGLCGIENLDAVAKPLPPVPPHDTLEDAAIFRALGDLRAHQQVDLERPVFRNDHPFRDSQNGARENAIGHARCRALCFTPTVSNRQSGNRG